LRKTPIFRRKLAKIAENNDLNIDPRQGEMSPFGEKKMTQKCSIIDYVHIFSNTHNGNANQVLTSALQCINT
jgi:hypothetical protein